MARKSNWTAAPSKIEGLQSRFYLDSPFTRLFERAPAATVGLHHVHVSFTVGRGPFIFVRR
jgi:hypothetical protein